MRIFILLLALVLLPLRGALGAGMPMESQPQPVQAAAVVMATVLCDEIGTHAHHLHHVDADADAGVHAGEHGTCQFCQLCHAGVIGQSVAALPAPDMGAVVPGPPLARFASVPPAPLRKPPIS